MRCVERFDLLFSEELQTFRQIHFARRCRTIHKENNHRAMHPGRVFNFKSDVVNFVVESLLQNRVPLRPHDDEHNIGRFDLPANKIQPIAIRRNRPAIPEHRPPTKTPREILKAPTGKVGGIKSTVREEYSHRISACGLPATRSAVRQSTRRQLERKPLPIDAVHDGIESCQKRMCSTRHA